MVEDDRIVWVGDDEAAQIGPEDQVTDVGGRTLMPGLIISHFHLEYRNLDVNSFTTVNIGMEQPPGVLMAICIKNGQNLLDSGFTGCISAASAHANDEQLRMAIAQGFATGPRIMPAGRHLNTTANEQDTLNWWLDPKSTHLGVEVYCDSPDEFRKAVRTEVKRGARIIKIYGSGGGTRLGSPVHELSQRELEVIVGTAHDLGVKVRSHCLMGNEADTIRCIEAGVDVIDHASEISEKALELMAGRGTFWAPTFHLSKVLLDMQAESNFAPALEAWNESVRLLGLAHSMGVRVLPGDDYGLNFFPHEPGCYGRELALYAEQPGIEPIDVLRWATLNGADLMGHAGELGVVTTGALADLIVVDGDPTADMTLLTDPQNLPVVMTNGTFYRNRLSGPPAV
jgi:imidazolonepropionase-like amidohydrolase